jgi:hypothetical protein
MLLTMLTIIADLVRLASTIISRMHNIFNNLLRRSKELLTPARAYLATPIGKITLLNSALFVPECLCR